MDVRFAYTGIRVTQLERALDFYAGLGLKVAERGVMSHGGVFVLLEDPRTGQRLELNWYPPTSPFNTPYTVGEALDHLGYGVEDARRSFHELVSRGAEPALEPWFERDGVSLAYIKDPDGIWIELFSSVKTTQLGLEYVGIRVTDLGRALRLYRDTMGLLESGRGTMSHGGVWVDLLDPWTMQKLELNWYPRGSRFDWAYEPGEALDHLGLTTERFDEDLERLREAGCELKLKPWLEGDTMIAFLEGTDGVWLELESKQ
jgi:Glyoxalase/Bleomycin resistance protein/Dioxygenase superfamily.